MDINKVRSDRFLFLKALYEASGGDEFKMLNMFNIGAALGFDREYAANIFDYLKGEGLAIPQALGGIIGITHDGIRTFENALSQPDKPTLHFPAVNIINVGSMVNSQIQQTSPNSKQTLSFGEERFDELQKLLADIKASIDKLGLKPQSQADIEGDITSAESQLKSSKPKTSVITECLHSIRSILESAVGSVLASDFMAKLSVFLRM